MPDASDMELLRDYNRQGSEEAFATLVQRHINLVYSTAHRHVGIPAHAEEITQAVFIILARKAASLRPDTILEGWLYETTRLALLSFIRGERRRQFREQEAYMQSTLQDSAADPTWRQLAPLLDEALARLGKKDRGAVVLRFFKDKSVREVAISLSVSEAAAQRRVLRAVEKLRGFFTKRGIAVSGAVMTASISANSVQAAPAVLAKSITAVAITKGVAASGSTLTLIKGVLEIMAWTKAKTAIVVGVGILFAAGTATLTVKQVLHYRDESVWNQITRRDRQQLENAPPASSIRLTKFTPQMTGEMETRGKVLGLYRPFDALLSRAYGIMPCRIIASAPLPSGNFDFIVSGQNPPKNALELAIKKEFGLGGKLETRETDVLLLTVRQRNAAGLKPTSKFGASSLEDGHLTHSGASMAQLAQLLEHYLEIPVVDQTGLSDRYVIDLKWPQTGEADAPSNRGRTTNPDGLKQALLGQLGLQLVPGRKAVEMLVVEKAR